jgi:hypothetical protein
MHSLGDLIFALGQWLHTTPLNGFALWIQTLPLNEAIVGNFWVVPFTQSIHILAIAAVFGSVAMINLRILELVGMGRTLEQTAGRYLPWIWWGLLVLLATGVVLILSDPIRELTNAIFWFKMILVAIAALVSLWFQGSVRRNLAWWQEAPERRAVVRAGAAGVLVLWCVIMVAGRWIAYAPT